MCVYIIRIHYIYNVDGVWGIYNDVQRDIYNLYHRCHVRYMYILCIYIYITCILYIYIYRRRRGVYVKQRAAGI